MELVQRETDDILFSHKPDGEKESSTLRENPVAMKTSFKCRRRWKKDETAAVHNHARDIVDEEFRYEISRKNAGGCDARSRTKKVYYHRTRHEIPI